MRIRSLVSVALLILPLSTFAQKKPTTEIGGRSVEMVLVKEEDLGPIKFDQGRFRLAQTTARLSSRSNVLIKLRESGIAPDSEALTIVYDLNPTVRDLSALSDGQSVILPLIEADKQSQQFLKKGYLIELTVDPEIRQQLNSRIDELQELVSSISKVTTDDTTQKRIVDTIDWFGQIEKRYKRRTGPPVRRATLLQMNDEATQLDSILRKAIQQQRSLTDYDREQIGSIFEDMKIEIRSYIQVLADVVPGSQQFYSVRVIIKVVDSSLAEGLRVYYTFNGLYRPMPADPPFPNFGFRELGSGKTENLLMKNYQIWAAKDGDPNHPLTPPYLLRIDEASPASLSVELSLTKGTEP